MANITFSSISCALQVALLGAITPNLRAIDVSFDNNNIELFFYYENPPSEEEVELTGIVENKVHADFIETSIVTERIVLPMSERIPEKLLRIYHRSE
jgi:hypothetical protein